MDGPIVFSILKVVFFPFKFGFFFLKHLEHLLRQFDDPAAASVLTSSGSREAVAAVSFRHDYKGGYGRILPVWLVAQATARTHHSFGAERSLSAAQDHELTKYLCTPTYLCNYLLPVLLTLLCFHHASVVGLSIRRPPPAAVRDTVVGLFVRSIPSLHNK